MKQFCLDQKHDQKHVVWTLGISDTLLLYGIFWHIETRHRLLTCVGLNLKEIKKKKKTHFYNSPNFNIPTFSFNILKMFGATQWIMWYLHDRPSHFYITKYMCQ